MAHLRDTNVDFSDILANLPPGVDLFTGIEMFIEAQATPELGNVFWGTTWLATSLCGVIALCILAGLVFRHKRGRLNLILHDGAVTRLDHRIVVPVLWCCESLFLIALSLQLFFAMEVKHEYTPSFGRYWGSIHIPLITSYCLISASVVVSAPPVRSLLGRTRYGVVIFNTATALFCLGISAALLPLAFETGRVMSDLSTALNGAKAIAADAKAKQDITLLYGLMDFVPVLLEAGKAHVRAAQKNSGCALGYLVFFLLTGFLPVLVLNSTVRRKIDRLENNSTSTTLGQMSTDIPMTPTGERPPLAVQLAAYAHTQDGRTSAIPLKHSSSASTATTLVGSSARHSDYVPPLPVDRPFGGLVSTAPLPEQYESILKDKSQSAAERAVRLKRALKHDQLLTAIYCFLLASLSAVCLFQLFKDKLSLTTAQDIAINYAWPVWNFILPALVMCIAFLADAYSHHASESSAGGRGLLPRHSGKAFQTQPVINQTVEIAYGEGRSKREKGDDDDDEVPWTTVRYT